MLTEADLDEVKEVSTENIPPNLASTESDLHLELSELRIGELNGMERSSKDTSAHGFKDEARATENVESQRDPYLPIEERPFGSGIQRSLHIDHQRGICAVRETKLQQR